MPRRHLVAWLIIMSVVAVIALVVGFEMVGGGNEIFSGANMGQ